VFQYLDRVFYQDYISKESDNNDLLVYTMEQYAHPISSQTSFRVMTVKDTANTDGIKAGHIGVQIQYMVSYNIAELGYDLDPVGAYNLMCMVMQDMVIVGGFQQLLNSYATEKTTIFATASVSEFTFSDYSVASSAIPSKSSVGILSLLCFAAFLWNCMSDSIFLSY
jgi:hypothetical protein